ncbi:hypothetical protein N302_03932, partial [Corvus brachyrhynchos]
KIQCVSPWKYLGLKIRKTTIVPQPIKLIDNPKTLQEPHQLCGSINWVRTWLGISTEDLAPLFNLLRGDRDLQSPRTLTAEAKTSLLKVWWALEEQKAHRYKPRLPFQLAVLGKVPHLHGILFQWDSELGDPLLIIEWVFLPHQPTKSLTTPHEFMVQLIMKARTRLRTLVGCDLSCIYLPITSEIMEYLLQSNANLQFALDSYLGQVSVHYPNHKIFNSTFSLIPREIQSRKQPLDALTIFTDGSGRLHKSVMTWQNPKTLKWESDVEVVSGSPQVAELAAVVRAFEKFKDPYNLVTDSVYVAGVTMRAENALLKEVSNKKIFGLLTKLICLISHREQTFYVMHVRSQTGLPG